MQATFPTDIPLKLHHSINAECFGTKKKFGSFRAQIFWLARKLKLPISYPKSGSGYPPKYQTNTMLRYVNYGCALVERIEYTEQEGERKGTR